MLSGKYTTLNLCYTNLGNKLVKTKQAEQTTRRHPEMVGDMSRVTLNFDLSKFLCAFLARVTTYTHTKN